MIKKDETTVRALIVINKKDNVATALTDLEKGIPLQIEKGSTKLKIIPHQFIAFGHKLAIMKIPVGEGVIKYGEIIGRAICDIEVGAHVHVHNVESQRGRGDLQKSEKH